MKHDTERRKVLMVAYEFPPEGSRGTKRAIKFIKYLPTLGWDPVVLTVRNGNHDFHDGSLIDEIPGFSDIHRTYTLESLFLRTNGYSSGEVKDALLERKRRMQNGGPARYLAKVYHASGRLFKVPDSRILWLPFAVKAGLSILKKRNIDAIFASGPSFTNHLVGVILKRTTGKPLVVDFRDAWASDPAIVWRNDFQRKMVFRLEKSVVTHADRVVATTEGISNDFASRYGAKEGKYVTVTNGYDISDFEGLATKETKDAKRPFTMVHAGTLGGERSPRHFLQALGNLISKNEVLRKDIQVIFVGQNTRFRDGSTIEQYIDQYGLQGAVTLTGFVARLKSLDLIAGADALLLIIGTVPKEKTHIYGISAKIYDYALAEKPVLTISDEGSTADMARRLRLGAVVAPEDLETIERRILGLYDAHKRGSLRVNVNRELLTSFDFRNLSARLADCLDSVIKQEDKGFFAARSS
jgi:glycosyltransferase involved in cell wall biosynthesis